MANQGIRILVSGSSGLVGRALVPYLKAQGHTVVRLLRCQAPSPDITWDPDTDRLDPAALEGFDAVIHLGGENVAQGRWTAAKKNRIRQSRVQSTRLLSETLARLKSRPGVFLCASAIGFYGDRGEETLTEASSPGTGFLAEVCQAWEGATQPAMEAGIRVVHMRIGMVLDTRGGALCKMEPVFRLGLGGPVGSGNQYISWIMLEDMLALTAHLLNTPSLAGPVNVVSPQPVTNRVFSRALGQALHRPAVAVLPAFSARLMFGEMADALLLASSRVVPEKLLESGFAFRFTGIEAALKHLYQ